MAFTMLSIASSPLACCDLRKSLDFQNECSDFSISGESRSLDSLELAERAAIMEAAGRL